MSSSVAQTANSAMSRPMRVEAMPTTMVSNVLAAARPVLGIESSMSVIAGTRSDVRTERSPIGWLAEVPAADTR
jgi:hypothetical protein